MDAVNLAKYATAHRQILTLKYQRSAANSIFFKVAEFKSECMTIYENWQVGMKNWNSEQFILAYDTSGSPCSTTPSNLALFVD